jgi:hypothetical protein
MARFDDIPKPEWVPEVIRTTARPLVEATVKKPEDWDVVRRLLTDKRMRSVWKELTKRIRQSYKPTAKFFRARPVCDQSLSFLSRDILIMGSNPPPAVIHTLISSRLPVLIPSCFKRARGSIQPRIKSYPKSSRVVVVGRHTDAQTMIRPLADTPGGYPSDRREKSIEDPRFSKHPDDIIGNLYAESDSFKIQDGSLQCCFRVDGSVK